MLTILAFWVAGVLKKVNEHRKESCHQFAWLYIVLVPLFSEITPFAILELVLNNIQPSRSQWILIWTHVRVEI